MFIQLVWYKPRGRCPMQSSAGPCSFNWFGISRVAAAQCSPLLAHSSNGRAWPLPSPYLKFFGSNPQARSLSGRGCHNIILQTLRRCLGERPGKRSRHTLPSGLQTVSGANRLKTVPGSFENGVRDKSFANGIRGKSFANGVWDKSSENCVRDKSFENGVRDKWFANGARDKSFENGFRDIACKPCPGKIVCKRCPLPPDTRGGS